MYTSLLMNTQNLIQGNTKFDSRQHPRHFLRSASCGRCNHLPARERIPAGIDLHRALADPWGSLHETFPPNRGIFPPGDRFSTRSSALSSIGALPLRRLAGVQAARPRPRAASGPSGSLPQWTSTAHTSREWQIARSSGRPRSTQSRRCQLPQSAD